MKKREYGAAAPQYLFLLLFLSLLATGYGLIISQGSTAIRRAEASDRRRQKAIKLAKYVIDEFRADPSPETDYRDDPGWALDGTEREGFSVSIIPLSDRLHPGFVRKNVFEKTGLSELFVSGKNADMLQQYREDHGLLLRSEDWESFFDKDTYSSFFSVYGWANINLVDEFSARLLGTALTGSESSGENMRNCVRNLLLQQRIETREGLKAVFGNDYDILVPAFNAEPSMNINFVPERILRELLAYPDYAISSPDSRAKSIIATLLSRPIQEREIPAMLNAEGTNRILCYFGSKTWFREIRLSDAKGVMHIIVVRIPEQQGSVNAPPEYKIIEMRED